MSDRILLEIYRDTLVPHYPNNPGVAYTFDELVEQGCIDLANRLRDGSARIVSGRWVDRVDGTGNGFFEVVWVVEE